MLSDGTKTKFALSLGRTGSNQRRQGTQLPGAGAVYGGFYVTVLAKGFIEATKLGSGHGCLFLQHVRRCFANP